MNKYYIIPGILLLKYCNPVDDDFKTKITIISVLRDSMHMIAKDYNTCEFFKESVEKCSHEYSSDDEALLYYEVNN